MNQEAKEEWEKPALIVLVRGTPEEAVLIGCKTEKVGDTPGTSAQHCGTLDGLGNCGACQSRGGGMS